MNLVNKLLLNIPRNEVLLMEGVYSPLCLLFRWNIQEFYNSFYKTPASPALMLIEGRNGLLAFNDSCYKSYAREVFKNYWNEDELVVRQNMRSRDLSNEIGKLYYLIQDENLNDVSEDQLVLWVKTMNKLVGELEALTIHIELFDEDIVLEVVGPGNKELVHKLWEKATYPFFESFEMRRLGMVLEEFRINPEKVLKHTQFIHTDYFDSKDVDERKKRLNEVIGSDNLVLENKEKLDTYRRELEKKQKSYEKWLGSLSYDEKKLSDYIQVVMHMRDWRKDPLAQAQTIFANICREMLVRINLSEEIAPYVLPQELELGTGYLKTQDLVGRKGGMIVFRDTDGSTIIEVCNIEAIRSELKDIALTKHVEITEVRGQVGAKGKVIGIVKVVTDASLADKFMPDDILVTAMTRPEFVPLMKKASGIVTDEGGITCHAAIVSRELKKPCIIGTKVATQILKDGMQVEVDADNGVVRIL